MNRTAGKGEKEIEEGKGIPGSYFEYLVVTATVSKTKFNWPDYHLPAQRFNVFPPLQLDNIFKMLTSWTIYLQEKKNPHNNIGKARKGSTWTPRAGGRRGRICQKRASEPKRPTAPVHHPNPQKIPSREGQILSVHTIPSTTQMFAREKGWCGKGKKVLEGRWGEE